MQGKRTLDGIHAASRAGSLKVFMTSCYSSSARLLLSYYFNSANINLQIYAELHKKWEFHLKEKDMNPAHSHSLFEKPLFWGEELNPNVCACVCARVYIAGEANKQTCVSAKCWRRSP